MNLRKQTRSKAENTTLQSHAHQLELNKLLSQQDSHVHFSPRGPKDTGWMLLQGTKMATKWSFHQNNLRLD